MANLTVKAQKNPVALLAILLIAHMIAVSLNRAPNRVGGMRYVQIWVMSALWPAQWATARISSAISYGWSHYLVVRDARSENDQLRAERSELQAKLFAAQEQVKLADQLRAFKEWQATQRYPTTIARVIARDADRWFNSVVINQGTIAGVQKNQPVVTPDGLVGRVILVGPTIARVLLLSDERHGTGAIIGQLADSRLLGVVKGKNESRCEMRFVSTPEKVASGEIVMTSGQDGIYPRGLVIGRVRRPEGESATTQTSIEVEPAAPLDKLDLVAVLVVPPDGVRAQVAELTEAEKKEKEKEAPGRKRR